MQRSDLGLWNESDTYRSRASQSIADCVKNGLRQIDDDPDMSQMVAKVSEHSVVDTGANILIEQSAGINMRVGLNEQQQQQQQSATENTRNLTNQPVIADRQFVHAPFGLFPMPLGHAAKLSLITRTKTKFKFLGKFMAKAIMDSRMVNRSQQWPPMRSKNIINSFPFTCSWIYHFQFHFIVGCWPRRIH